MTVHVEKIDGRDVDIDESVAVYVGHRDAGRPPAAAAHPGAVGHILEMIVSLVEV